MVHNQQARSKRIIQNYIYTTLRSATGVLTSLLIAHVNNIDYTLCAMNAYSKPHVEPRQTDRRTIHSERAKTQIELLHRAQQFCVTIKSAYNKQLNRTVSRVAYQLRARRSPLSSQTRTARAFGWGKTIAANAIHLHLYIGWSQTA